MFVILPEKGLLAKPPTSIDSAIPIVTLSYKSKGASKYLWI